jgi:hypothetical protein
MTDKPCYDHDCTTCVFLGHYGAADLYVHPSGHKTVIARYSSKGSDYASGLFATGLLDLNEAKRRAVERGILSIQEYPVRCAICADTGEHKDNFTNCAVYCNCVAGVSARERDGVL